MYANVFHDHLVITQGSLT